jgi:hypothetical protein
MTIAAISRAPSAASLSTVKMFCVAAPGFTPRMFTADNSSTDPSASGVTAPPGKPTIFIA